MHPAWLCGKIMIVNDSAQQRAAKATATIGSWGA
jgi:hypothetical protein